MGNTESCSGGERGDVSEASWRPSFVPSDSDDEGETLQVTTNTCKKLPAGRSGEQRRSFNERNADAGYLFTYNVLAEASLRRARERMMNHHSRDGEEGKKDVKRGMESVDPKLDLKIETKTNFGEQLVTKKHMLPFTISVSILGVDGLKTRDSVALKDGEMLRCRLSLVNEDGKVMPFRLGDSSTDQKEVRLKNVASVNDPESEFRFCYDKPENIYMTVLQPICSLRWTGTLLVEILKMDNIVAASFSCDAATLEDKGEDSYAKFYCPRRLNPGDSSWKTSSGVRGIPEKADKEDDGARLYLRLCHKNEDFKAGKYMSALVSEFDEAVTYLVESRDICIESCKSCKETGTLEFKDSVDVMHRKAVRVRSVDGVLQGIRMVQNVECLVRMGLERIRTKVLHETLIGALLRRIGVAAIVLKVRHLRFWAEHTPPGWFAFDGRSSKDDAPVHPQWSTLTEEVKAAFFRESSLAYREDRLQALVRRMYEENVSDGKDRDTMISKWMCNATCFAALNAVELLMVESLQIKAATKAEEKAHFMECMRRQLGDVNEILEKGAANFKTMNRADSVKAIEHDLLQKKSVFSSSGALAEIISNIENKIERKSFNFSADLHNKLIDLKTRILSIPSAKDKNIDFHATTLLVDTGRDHGESGLSIPATLWGSNEGEDEDNDDGSFIHLQQREFYEESDQMHRTSTHRSKSVLHSRIDIFSTPATPEASTKNAETKRTRPTSDESKNEDDAKSASKDAAIPPGLKIKIPSKQGNDATIGPPERTPPGGDLRTPPAGHFAAPAHAPPENP